jgi:hypothetical protein
VSAAVTAEARDAEEIGEYGAGGDVGGDDVVTLSAVLYGHLELQSIKFLDALK